MTNDLNTARELALMDERAAFEAEIRKDAGDLSTFGSGQNRHYRNSAVNNAWGGWKARAAIASRETPTAPPDRDAMGRLVVEASGGEAVAGAAGEAFENLFHKCRAEVSMDWWQRIWAMAVRWAWENPQADTAPTLRSALNAMLTQFGMDEDEWSKPTFEQARRALAAPQQSASTKGDGKPLTKSDWRKIESLRPIVDGGPDCKVAMHAALAWKLIEVADASVAPTPSPLAETGEVEALRAEGWSVAVHNDYKLQGVPHTFWLFTKGDRAIKGEGQSDAEALAQVRAALTAAQPADGKGEGA